MSLNLPMSLNLFSVVCLFTICYNVQRPERLIVTIPQIHPYYICLVAMEGTIAVVAFAPPVNVIVAECFGGIYMGTG